MDTTERAMPVTPAAPASEEAIRRLVAEAEQHQNDTDQFIELHTDAASIVNIAGRRVLGKVAIYRAMKAALESSLAKVLTRTEIEDVRFLGPDVAIVGCLKHVSDQRDAETRTDPSASVPAAGRLTYVVVNEGDRWRIASAQTTPIK